MLPIIKFLLDCFENILDTASLFLTFFWDRSKKRGNLQNPWPLFVLYPTNPNNFARAKIWPRPRSRPSRIFIFNPPPGWFSSSIGLTSYDYVFCRAEYFSAKSWAPLVRKAHCVSLPLFGIAVRVDCRWFDASTSEQLNHCLPFYPKFFSSSAGAVPFCRPERSSR